MPLPRHGGEPRLVELTPDRSPSNQGPPQRDENDHLENNGEPTHDDGALYRHEDHEGQLQGDGEETDDGSGAVLERRLVNARRRGHATAPERLENFSLLLARATSIDVKFHQINDRAHALRR